MTDNDPGNDVHRYQASHSLLECVQISIREPCGRNLQILYISRRKCLWPLTFYRGYLFLASRLISLRKRLRAEPLAVSRMQVSIPSVDWNQRTR